MDHGIDVRTDRLPQRRPERMRLVLDCVGSGEGAFVVGVDDADGAFVRLAGLPVMPDPRVCGLSSDGRSILFNSSREFDTSLTRLCLLYLPTGEETWLELAAHTPRDTAVALSPDGGRIAVLSDFEPSDQSEQQEFRQGESGQGASGQVGSGQPEGADGLTLACVDVIDAGSGDRERLWTSPTESWSSSECDVVWSPDGLLISVTHMWFDGETTHNDWETVVVLDAATGTALHRLDFFGHVGWLNNRDLLMWRAEPWETVLDTGTGALRDLTIAWEPGQTSGGAACALNDRVVAYRGFNDGSRRYFRTDAYGQEARPLFVTALPALELFLAAGIQPLDHLGHARPGTGTTA